MWSMQHKYWILIKSWTFQITSIIGWSPNTASEKVFKAFTHGVQYKKALISRNTTPRDYLLILTEKIFRDHLLPTWQEKWYWSNFVESFLSPHRRWRVKFSDARRSSARGVIFRETDWFVQRSRCVIIMYAAAWVAESLGMEKPQFNDELPRAGWLWKILTESWFRKDFMFCPWIRVTLRHYHFKLKNLNLVVWRLHRWRTIRCGSCFALYKIWSYPHQTQWSTRWDSETDGWSLRSFFIFFRFN